MSGDGEAVARLRHARGPALQCLGQPPRRRTGRRGELQPRRQGVRRGGARGRAPRPRPGTLADAHAASPGRGTSTGTVQQAILMVLRVVVIGLALLFWWQGTATLGDVTFVLTAFLRDPRLPARHRPAHAQPAAFGQRHGGARRLPWTSRSASRTGPARADPIARGDIRFDQVRSAMPARRPPLYDDFSVAIAPGERVGLVGRSGSGKTTFVKLIQRLYDLDERPHPDRRAGHRRRRRRRACARRSRSCSRSRCCSTARWPRTSPMAGPAPPRRRSSAAARLANAHDFIERLPQRLRDAGRRARRQALGRRAAAGGASRAPSWPTRRS